MILLGEDFEVDDKPASSALDSAVFPGTQGGPLMHIIAAKAVGFYEAMDPSFKEYSEQVVSNAQTLAEELRKAGYDVVSGGTDNHLVLVDLRNKGLTGKEAEEALEAVGITANKNMVPFDDKSPFVTSGLRLGTPAMTTRGFGEAEFREIAWAIDEVLRAPENEANRKAAAKVSRALCEAHPLPY